MVESEVGSAVSALEAIEQAVASRAPYEQIVAALDACAAGPDAESVSQAIAEWRVTAALHYERSVSECEEALLQFLKLDLSLVDSASKRLAVCATHLELADRYLPPLIAELEAAPHDQAVNQMLATAYELRQSNPISD